MADRYVSVIRALALGTALGAASCADPNVSADATPDVPGYRAVASAQGGYCVCCPSGDWSGQCYSNPMVAPDAGGPGAPMTPPEGYRWCASADLQGSAGACPIAGPLNPPEMATA